MTIKNACLLLRSPNFSITSRRNLVHESFLGLPKFKMHKVQQSQSSDIRKNFEKLFANPELLVHNHLIKKFVYIINTEEDFKMFSDIFKRYANKTEDPMKSIKFEVFTIGPEIMRVYYTMNKPVEAFNLVKNPDTFFFFCNLSSLVILQDLLYENGMYEEVCDVFNIIKQKQFYKKTYHFAPYILYQAACYKMATPNSYNSVMAMYEKFRKHNNSYWPLHIYTLMYALKNNSLDIPVKHTVTFDPASVNIKLSALIKSGNYSDALRFCNILRCKSVILRSVAEDLCKPLENDGAIQDQSLITELQQFKKEIEQNRLIDMTLDELAADFIRSIKAKQGMEI